MRVPERRPNSPVPTGFTETGKLKSYCFERALWDTTLTLMWDCCNVRTEIMPQIYFRAWDAVVLD